MNGQPKGGSGEVHGSVPEASPQRPTVPTPVASPAGTPSAAPETSAREAGRPAHGPYSWAAPVQDAGISAGGWGAPAAKPGEGSAAQSWTVKRGLAVAGAAAVLAAGAGLGVYALTSSPATADGTGGAAGGGLVGPGGQGSGQGGPGAQGGFGGGAAPGQGGAGNFQPDGVAVGGLSAAVHGEYVVLQGSEYVTKAEQLGTVTEASSGAVTVKSSDGFSRSYVLGQDVLVTNQQQRRQQGNAGTRLTAADIVNGGTVRIVSSRNGSDYTAESVIVIGTTASGSPSGATSGTQKAS
jgi:hypothetical protein